MAIQSALFNKQVQAIVTKKTKAVITRHKNLYKKRLSDITAKWKTEVKLLLSVPYSGKPNHTPFPYKRTGDLRDSLHYRVVEGKFLQTQSTNQAQFTIIPLWRPVLNKKGEDYGDILNDQWKGSSFHGWKDRTNQILRNRILGSTI